MTEQILDNIFSEKDFTKLNCKEIVQNIIKEKNEAMPSLASCIIKRFRLKKLKSPNEDIYYYDKIYHFIWKLKKYEDSKEEDLIRISTEMYDILRKLNNIYYEPFLEQPEIFW
jgi:hypothetical protein